MLSKLLVHLRCSKFITLQVPVTKYFICSRCLCLSCRDLVEIFPYKDSKANTQAGPNLGSKAVDHKTTAAPPQTQHLLSVLYVKLFQSLKSLLQGQIHAVSSFVKFRKQKPSFFFFFGYKEKKMCHSLLREQEQNSQFQGQKGT